MTRLFACQRRQSSDRRQHFLAAREARETEDGISVRHAFGHTHRVCQFQGLRGRQVLRPLERRVKRRVRQGDHLATPRFGYTHHGICIGNERIVHYSGFAKGWTAGPVEEVSLEEFANGSSFQVIEHPIRKHGRRASASRAKGWIGKGEQEYCVLTNNCEHFVTGCIEGKKSSVQTDFRIKHLSSGLVVALLGVVSYSLLSLLG
jgi:hypothetical protein